MQVQRRLGHHKPSFTIDVYVHLLESDEPEPLAAGNTGATRARRSRETWRPATKSRREMP
jgi:hypothetical protein